MTETDQPLTDTDATARHSRWYLWAGLGVVLVVIVIVILAAVRPRPQHEYDAAVHDRFLAACTAQGGEPVRDTCECFYGELEQNVPFDRFELLDETLAIQTQSLADGQPLGMPEDITAMLQACVDRP